jgi:hypothetical protein
MMKYDTSKTLNENKESNKQLIKEFVPVVIAGYTIAAPWVAGATAAAVTAVGTWIYNIQGGGDSFSKTQTFFQGCSSLDANLKPTQDKSAHREAADSIYNAIQGFGTNEDAIRGAISSMETVADLCAMYKYYNKTYGDLYDDLDSDLDGESFRQYVWSAIAPIVEDAEEDLSKAEEEKPEGGNAAGGSTGGGYKDCSGTYSFGCKSEAIRKVQGCLGGLTTDGKFGPNTQKALKAKGFDSFTDADVDKICAKTQDQADEFTTQVDADNMDDIMNS